MPIVRESLPLPATPIFAATRRNFDPGSELDAYRADGVATPQPPAGIAFDDIRPRMLVAVAVADRNDHLAGSDGGDESGRRRGAATVVLHQQNIAAQQVRRARQ